MKINFTLRQESPEETAARETAYAAAKVIATTQNPFTLAKFNGSEQAQVAELDLVILNSRLNGMRASASAAGISYGNQGGFFGHANRFIEAYDQLSTLDEDTLAGLANLSSKPQRLFSFFGMHATAERFAASRAEAYVASQNATRESLISDFCSGYNHVADMVLNKLPIYSDQGSNGLWSNPDQIMVDPAFSDALLRLNNSSFDANLFARRQRIEYSLDPQNPHILGELGKGTGLYVVKDPDVVDQPASFFE